MQNLEDLSTEELQVLVDRARRILAERKLEEGSRLRMVDSYREDDTRYLLEYVTCSRATSGKCREREYHGPYWYSYTWTGEKTISKYHGKNRPGTPKAEEEQ